MRHPGERGPGSATRAPELSPIRSGGGGDRRLDVMFRVLCLAIATLALSGCVVDVSLGFDTCEDEAGGVRQPGEEYDVLAPGGVCQRCVCGGSCEDIPCGPPPPPQCEHEGVLLGEKQVVTSADGCETCTCNAAGELECTVDPCCSPPSLACQGIPDALSCYEVPVCGPAGWTCDPVCDCSGQLPYCPTPPVGCGWSEPVCSGGQWSCGELVCEGCGMSPPQCMDPWDPGCSSDATCNGLGWECATTCTTCMDPPPDCYVLFGCSAPATCGEMGWTCEEACAAKASDACAMTVVPDCTPADMLCSGQPVCLEASWYCAEVCP